MGGGVGRGRERILSRLRAQLGDDPGLHLRCREVLTRADIKSQTLNLPNCPGAPQSTF